MEMRFWKPTGMPGRILLFGSGSKRYRNTEISCRVSIIDCIILCINCANELCWCITYTIQFSMEIVHCLYLIVAMLYYHTCLFDWLWAYRAYTLKCSQNMVWYSCVSHQTITDLLVGKWSSQSSQCCNKTHTYNTIYSIV